MKFRAVIAIALVAGSLNAGAQWTSSGNDISNSNSGNVGIGTSSPGVKLQLNGSFKVVGTSATQVVLEGANSYSPGFVFDGSQSNTSMYTLTSQNFLTSAGNESRFNGGSVLIYNNAVVNAYQQPLKIKRVYPYYGGQVGLELDNDQSGPMPDATDYKIISAKFTGSEVSYIRGDGSGYFAGKLGIGTQNIADNNYKLFVETGIRTRKVKVDAPTVTWPDYVFHQQYDLMPLPALAMYINEHHHLPGVPSAAEVESQGLDLGEGQAVLLKKIEELTLYIIELDKKVEQLKAENESLKQKREN